MFIEKHYPQSSELVAGYLCLTRFYAITVLQFQLSAPPVIAHPFAEAHADPVQIAHVECSPWIHANMAHNVYQQLGREVLEWWSQHVFLLRNVVGETETFQNENDGGGDGSENVTALYELLNITRHSEVDLAQKSLARLDPFVSKMPLEYMRKCAF